MSLKQEMQQLQNTVQILSTSISSITSVNRDLFNQVSKQAKDLETLADQASNLNNRVEEMTERLDNPNPAPAHPEAGPPPVWVASAQRVGQIIPEMPSASIVGATSERVSQSFATGPIYRDVQSILPEFNGKRHAGVKALAERVKASQAPIQRILESKKPTLPFEQDQELRVVLVAGLFTPADFDKEVIRNQKKIGVIGQIRAALYDARFRISCIRDITLRSNLITQFLVTKDYRDKFCLDLTNIGFKILDQSNPLFGGPAKSYAERQVIEARTLRQYSKTIARTKNLEVKNYYEAMFSSYSGELKKRAFLILREEEDSAAEARALQAQRDIAAAAEVVNADVDMTATTAQKRGRERESGPINEQVRRQSDGHDQGAPASGESGTSPATVEECGSL